MERSKAGTKKSPDGLSSPNQNTIINIILYKRKKYNEIQLTKNKVDLNNRKIKIIHRPQGGINQTIKGENVVAGRGTRRYDVICRSSNT